MSRKFSGLVYDKGVDTNSSRFNMDQEAFKLARTLVEKLEKYALDVAQTSCYAT